MKFLERKRRKKKTKTQPNRKTKPTKNHPKVNKDKIATAAPKKKKQATGRCKLENTSSRSEVLAPNSTKKKNTHTQHRKDRPRWGWVLCRISFRTYTRGGFLACCRTAKYVLPALVARLLVCWGGVVGDLRRPAIIPLFSRWHNQLHSSPR